MSELGRHLRDYLSMRRALGYKLAAEGRLLTDFAGFAERAGVGTVTVEAAVDWAVLPESADPTWVAKRLGIVRGFARYLATVDAAAEIPPTDLLPARTRRCTPYLYSDAEIAALLAAARALPNPLKSATFETLIGLLAATGLRGGEAMRLDRSDLDWTHGLLTVHAAKFGKSRQLHLHPTTVHALHRYAARRDRLCPRPATASFFVSTTGTRLCHAVLQPTFRTGRPRRHRPGRAPTPSARARAAALLRG
jgi:integrase